MLYMCSSVYVFMFAAKVAERQSWFQSISCYANQAAAATVNQRTLPVLILVFNKVPKEDGVWEVDKATLHAQIGDQFSNVFREVHVVRIF
jgi:hypothetical protein